ncbi:MAG: acylneuraminate cytidylyltransferase family protein [Planctomycetes bacterium]|nr:acylneuraminate cytidylyltransferase family protein [Planctomycetota bacterium]
MAAVAAAVAAAGGAGGSIGGEPRCIALVPARAGSKRVPNKNVRLLGAHPLIAYTIAAARASGVFQRVVVSTDSQEIARIARHYGAEAPFIRPSAMAADRSPDIEWVEHALRTLAEGGESYDCFSILRPTSPFRLPATIRRAWQEFRAAKGADSLRAVELCRQHPGKMWIVEGKTMKPLLPSPPGVPFHSTPYQALPAVFVQNASLEIAWTRVVLAERSIAGSALAPFLTEGLEGFDINDADDWLVAEARARERPEILPEVAAAPLAPEPRGKNAMKEH